MYAEKVLIYENHDKVAAAVVKHKINYLVMPDENGGWRVLRAQTPL